MPLKKSNGVSVTVDGKVYNAPNADSVSVTLGDGVVVTASRRERSAMHCFICKKVNRHHTRDCPDKGKKKKNKSGSGVGSSSTTAASSEQPSKNAGNLIGSVAGQKSSETAGNTVGDLSSLTKSQKARRRLCFTCGKPGHTAAACASYVTRPTANAGVTKPRGRDARHVHQGGGHDDHDHPLDGQGPDCGSNTPAGRVTSNDAGLIKKESPEPKIEGFDGQTMSSNERETTRERPRVHWQQTRRQWSLSPEFGIKREEI